MPSDQPGPLHSLFAAGLEQKKLHGEYRVFTHLSREGCAPPYAKRDNRQIIHWCGNDYLNMGQEPEVIAAAADALHHEGAGAGGTRNIGGSRTLHANLESLTAKMHGKDAALLFTSGYVANSTVLSTLGRGIPGCIFLSDERNHASMIEGINRSGAHKRIFRHNDAGHLRDLLTDLPLSRPKIIALEALYSMDGDFAPLADVVTLAHAHNAFIYLDEVHSIGVYGNAAGYAAQLGLSDRIDLIQGNYAKGIGVFGGYVAGDGLTIDWLRSFAPGFIFTTALPPAVIAACIASLKLLHGEHGRVKRQDLQNNVTMLASLLSQTGIPHHHRGSHIITVTVGDAHACKEISGELLARGHYLQPINYPTVARGEECLRLTASPAHTHDMCRELVEALADVMRDTKAAASSRCG